MIPQSQTIEPNPDETASDSPNQESTVTKTHDIAHHPIPPIDQTFESQSQDSINNDHTPIEAERPSNWHLMSGRAKNNWSKKHKSKGK